MASEYSVNIKLNTSQVKKDLKTIGDGIGNLGKQQSKGAKSALSDAEKQLKLENTSLALKNRGLGLSLKALPLQLKGVKLDEAALKIQQAATDAEKFEFDLAKNSLLLADKQIKKAQILLKVNKDTTKNKVAQEKLQKQMASPIGGSKFMMGSPAQMAFSGGPSVPIGGSRFIPGSPAQLAFSARTGGPRSPIGGSTSIPGSPAFLRNQQRSRLRGFDVGSALISGGFPLLFGQGPVTAAAGALGGGIGGMFGQMGGFAGGIAATTAVQSLSNFTKAIGELGNALSRPTENIGSLVEKLGLANDPAGRLALRLEKLGLTSSASALLMEEFTKQTGKSPDALKNAAEEINEMNKSLATFGLKLQLLGAEVITPIVDLLNKIPFGSIGEKLKPLGNFLLFGPGGNPTETINRMKGISNIPASEGNAIIGGVPLNPDFGKTTAQLGKTSALEALASQTEFTRNILPLQQSLELEKQRFSLSSQDLTLKREANKLDLKSKELELLKSQAAIKTNQDLDLKIEKLTAEVDLQKQIFENAQILADPIKAQTIQLDQQMRVLLNSGHQVVALSQAISSSFEQSFKGIISGTMSVQDGFRNMLNSIANHFLNTAAKMMANQMQRSLLGFLGNNLFGGFFGGGMMGGAGGGYFDPVTGLGVAGPNFGLANGGTARAGKTHLVGERGPELFTPGVTGTVTPNHALGGSTNIVVNVDASGSSVEGDEEGGRQLGSIISAAIQAQLIQEKRPGGLLS